MPRLAARASIVALAVAGLTFAVASPVFAAGSALPSSDALYALSCDDLGAPTVLSVDPTTGESTGVGSVTGDCSYNAAFDEVTGTMYFTDFDQGVLSTFDVSTGVTTSGPQFTVDGVPVLATSIAIGAHREAYAFAGNALYALDLDSGALTEVAPNPSHTFYSFAYDRVTGQFYALSQNGDLFLVNRGTKTIDPAGVLPTQVSRVYGMQFDSDGTLWYVDTSGSSGITVLYSATLADLANPVESGELVWGDGQGYYAFSLAITRPVVPELAATGSDASAIVTGALAAAMVILLGAGALVARRRRAL